MNFDATSYLIDFEKDVQLAGIGTRIGGDPDWIEKAQWPVDQSDPLKEFRFVSQFKIPIELFPDSNAQIAYFFIKDSENGDGNSSIPTVILSPGTNDEVVTEKKSVGSTVLRRVPKRDDGTDIFPENFEKKPCLAPIQRGHMVAAAKNKEPLNKMGGKPDFVQGSQFPDEEQKWLLLFQFNKNTVPFEMDLPEDSMCYGFINEDGTQCKVVIQKR